MNYSPAPPPRLARSIPGQPGLFRFGGTVFYPPHRYREHAGQLWHRVGGSDESPTLIPVRGLPDSAKRTAMSGLGDFSVPAPLPPPPYTWSVPRGPKWVLGDLSTTRALLAQVSSDYDKIKRGAQPLLERYPFSAATYTQIATSVVAAPRASTMRLGMGEFTQVCRGVLSTVARSISLAQGLLTSPHDVAQNRAKVLLLAATRTISTFRLVLTSVNLLNRGARAAGLGVLVADDILILAALAAGTLVFLVGAGALYSVIADAQANEQANAEAERACALDAAAGRPCGGAEFQAALNRARESQNEWGFLPNLSELFKKGGSLLFWGGLLTVAAVLGYAAYTAEPARRNVQERLRTASMSGLRRR